MFMYIIKLINFLKNHTIVFNHFIRHFEDNFMLFNNIEKFHGFSTIIK